MESEDIWSPFNKTICLNRKINAFRSLERGEDSTREDFQEKFPGGNDLLDRWETQLKQKKASTSSLAIKDRR